MTKIQTPTTSPRPFPWVSAALLAERSTRLSSLQTFGDTIFWLETRAADQNRTVIVSKSGEDAPRDVTAPAYNVRTTVNEYGGGAYCVGHDGRVIFSSGLDDRVYVSDGQETSCLSGTGGCRYADFSVVSKFADLAPTRDFGVVCVREDHRLDGEAVTTLVYLTHDAEWVIAEGHDFYAAPRMSPDGRYLAYICWDHPNMPWDETRLVIATLDWRSGRPLVMDRKVLEGEDRRCSVMEPLWRDVETLYALSDLSSAWRPVMFRHEGGWTRQELPDPGFEIGLPGWVFGQRTMSCLQDGGLLALGHDHGVPRVVRYDGAEWRAENFGFTSEVPLSAGEGFVWMETPDDGPPVLRGGRDVTHSHVLRVSFEFPAGIGPEDCAHPQPVTFSTRDGEEAHAFYYPPVGQVALAAPGEPPPLLVMAHGGPTAAASPSFSFKVHWWVTRGFGVLDVNYRGSTGWGRRFRQALYGLWGARDVEDCVDAAEEICARGWADRARCVIRGSSAGGLTVLQALAGSDVFCAGTSLYGVTDLMSLAAETHKFESRYLDRLVGPLPEAASIYQARSPLQHAEKIKVPVLFLHGELDRVVPLSQAREMHRSLVAQGVGTELVVYPGEAHGFRKPETLQDSFTREHAFYLDVFRRNLNRVD